MSYLRFTPADYRAVLGVCRRLDLPGLSLPAFRRVLAVCLTARAPELAERLRQLPSGKIRLLYEHIRTKTTRRVRFSDEELRTLAGALFFVLGRCVRPYQRRLVRHFRRGRPRLARKLGRLSATQFVELCEEVAKIA